MAATIRPSLILNMDVDERQYSDDLVAEIKRSYSYVAPSVVAPMTVSDGEPIENTIRLVVRMHRPYWDANDEASQEQWAAVMPKWLSNMFFKVSSTVTACNDVRRKAGDGPLPYAWMEVEFGDNLTLAQATAANSAFPEDALAVTERVRDLMAAGAFGDGVARVSVPARSLWEEARAEAIAAAATPADEAEPTDEAAGADDAASEAVAGEGLAAVGLAGEAVEGAEAAGAVGAEAAAAPLMFAPEFTVERGCWGIEYADGTERLFDSAAEAFLA